MATITENTVNINNDDSSNIINVDYITGNSVSINNIFLCFKPLLSEF